MRVCVHIHIAGSGNKTEAELRSVPAREAVLPLTHIPHPQ